MEYLVRGKIWKFGRDVDTDQIIPAERLVTGDPRELGKYLFEKARPEITAYARRFISGEVKPQDEFNIMVADENFGCGSSREHAPRALVGAGIKSVVAKSFARIFYRNSINLGIPLVECDLYAEEGDIVEIDFKKGEVKNIARGILKTFPSYPPFLQEIMDLGGIVEYTKRELAKRNAQP